MTLAVASTASEVRGLLEQMAHRGGEVLIDEGARAAVGVRTGPEVHLQRFGDTVTIVDGRLDEPEASRTMGESVLALHERRGNGAPCLRGQFAFAIVDTARGDVVAARDPLASRPLYRDVRGRFASEPGALAEHGAELDQVCLFLGGLYTDSNATLWKDVYTVPAGHWLDNSGGRTRVRRFWEPKPWRSRSIGLRDAGRELRELLDRSVARRLPSSGPVAVYLSGGLDSATAVACLSALKSSVVPVAVHAAFPDSPDDETRESRLVAEHFGVEHRSVDVLADIGAFAPKAHGIDVLWDPRVMMWDLLHRDVVGRGAVAGLSGDGLDECLQPTGVEWADDLAAGKWLDVANAAGVLRRPWSRSGWRQLVAGALAPWFRLEWGYGGDLGLPLSKRTQSHLADERAGRRGRLSRWKGCALVDQLLCQQFYEGEHEAVVSFNERSARRAGARVRDAFFDLDVVEYLLTLPHDLRHQVGLDKPKPVLREAMRGRLPEAILRRPSSGRYNHLFEVVLTAHAGAIADLWRDSRLADAGIVDGSKLRAGWIHAISDRDVRLLVGWTQLVAMEILLRTI